jgi:hypothetical protein
MNNKPKLLLVTPSVPIVLNPIKSANLMKVFLLSASLFFYSFANATIFYISPSGNDANNGSAGAPWKTLLKAASAVTTPGDIIHVNAGTYIEATTVSLAVGVSIEGEGATSVIQCAINQSNTPTTAWNQPVIAAFSPMGTNGNQHISNLRFEGRMINGWCIYMRGRSNFQIYNCYFENYIDRGVIYDGRNDNSGLEPTTYATGNTFRDNTINNSSTWNGAYGTGCLNIGGQQGMLIYNNTITQNQRPSGQNGWPIKYWNEGWTRGCKIYNNNITKIPYNNDGWDFCLEMFNNSGLEIYSNTFQGSLDFNYQEKGAYPYSIYIHDNVISQPSINSNIESGIIVEFSIEGLWIKNNTFNNLTKNVVFYPRTGDTIKDVSITNNVATNVYGASGTFYGGFESGDGRVFQDSIAIYNNTITAKTGNAPNFAVNFGTTQPGYYVRNTHVKNNIIQGFVTNGFRSGSLGLIVNSSFSHNNLYQNGDNVNLFPAWASGSTLPAGTVLNNLSVNPLFVSATNFNLQSTSPLINVGINVGLPYNGAAPDLGYAEYAGVTNAPPAANAGPDQTIAIPTSLVSLTGSGTDADGTITTYLWTKVSGPAGPVITNPGSALTTVTGFTTPGTYQFELKVTDNNGAVGKDTMIVTLTNAAPTANAGPNETIILPTSLVNLAGSGTDTDGTITAYLWTKIAGPAGPVITNPASAITTITGFTAMGTYLFELKVTDNYGAVGRDTMEVIVNPDPNIAPTANAGTNQTISAPVSSVTVTGSGNDPDGTVTGYLWTKISGPAGGTITNPSSALTDITGFVLSGVYQFELKVTDNNGAVGRDTMQVTLTNVAPTANAGADKTIALPTSSVSVTGTGTDTDGSISTYLWTKILSPTGPVITNSTSAITTITGFTTVGIYQFELRVTDNGGAIARDTMQVTVNPDPNIAPTADAGANQTITLPASTINLTGSGNDTDGSIAAYLWTKITGPAGPVITNPASASTSVTGFITAGVYQFELRVTDNNGAIGRDTMQVTVNPDPNIAPTANAGINQTITLPTNSVTLSGSGNDPDGSIAAYLWTKIAGPAGPSITNPSSASTAVTGFITAGIYQFELRVTDNNGAVGRDTMQVTVIAANIAPTANAGANQTITLPISSVTLAGSGNDADGTISTYAWRKISAQTSGAITNAASASTTVTGLVQGVYLFELIVTDNNGATGKDTVQVTVNAANIAPAANAGPDQNITLPINTVTLTGTGNDVDGTIAGYLWTKIAGPGGGGGALTNPNAASTSVTGLIAGIYKFELRVTDNSGAVGRDTIQVNVFAPNMVPTANAGLNQSMTLPTNSTTLNGSGNDADGTITTYRWARIAGPTTYTLTNSTAAITTITGLIAGVYLFELQVTDNSGAVGKDTVQITVNAENIPPVANAGSDQFVTLPTNTVTLSGSGTDADGSIVAYAWKQLSGPVDKLTSLNTAVSVLNNLVEGVYNFELTVTDNRGAIDKDSVMVTLSPAAFAVQNNAKIFPNPVVDITTLQINTTNNVLTMLIIISDVQGKMVYQKQVPAGNGSTKERIDMSKLSGGTYFVTVYFDGQQKQTLQVIKR